MAVFSSDAFAGTAGTALQTYSATWAKHPVNAVDLVITAAGRARNNNAGTSGVAYKTDVPPSADYSVKTTITPIATTASNAGPIGRLDTAALTGYMAGYNHTAQTCTLYRIAAGTFTALAAAVPQALALSASAVLEVRMVGDQISLAWNGSVIVGPITDTNVTAAGRAGLRGTTGASDAAGTHYDDFEAATFDAPVSGYKNLSLLGVG